MILFTQTVTEGKRGGVITTLKIFEYFKSRFQVVKPDILLELDDFIRSPLKHTIYNYRQVKNLKPRVLVVDISSSIRSILSALRIKIKKGKLVVVMLGLRMSFRHNNILISTLVRIAEYLTLKMANVILVNSKYTAKFVESKVDIQNKKLIIAYPGIDNIYIKNIGNSNSMIRANDITRIIFVGECAKVKGLSELIEAIISISDLSFRLDILGNYDESDNYYLTIKERIDENNLQGRVKFHGFKSKESLIEWYANADIFVMPSLFEGYGKTLVEALTFGLPIIASKVGVVQEFVEHGRNALLVEPGNSIFLAKALMRLINDNDLRKFMMNENAKLASRIPTWENYYTTLDNNLKPIIDRYMQFSNK